MADTNASRPASAGDEPEDGPSDEAPDDGPALQPEDVEDALLEGDRTFAPGTARAALSYPVFRRVYTGSLLSNIGTWMQSVVLAAYAYDITGSATFVSLITLAQLGPLLVFSLAGGALADIIDRRVLLVACSVEQLLLSLVLAVLVVPAEPSLGGIVLVVAAIGVGQALFAPTYSALMPTLVQRRDLTGAVALNSANMNLSRVIGPAIGGVLYARVGAPAVMVGNAVTYVFIIAAVWRARLPAAPRPPAGSASGLRRVAEGFQVARRDRVIRRCLLTMTTFSFFCLPFVVEMPVLAAENFGINPRSGGYGLLYACFGLGAVAGALSIGTFLAGQDLAKVVRMGLAGFAVSLTTFALLRNAAPAYPMALIVGFTYFTIVTSLSTVLQHRLDDAVRGRVMALWIMAFGGTVPIGGMVAGPVIDATNVTVVILFGAAVAVALLFYADLRPPREVEVTRRG